MDGNDLSSDHVIAKLIELGFEFSEVMEAIEAVGPSVDNAVEFILNGSRRSSMGLCSGSGNSTSNAGDSCKRVLLKSHSFGRLRQSSIMDHIQSSRSAKRRKVRGASNASVPVSGSDVDSRHLEEQKASLPNFQTSMEPSLELFQEPVCMQRYQEIGSDWEQKVNNLLQKHFGFSSLKHFQNEALEAWLAHRDCLVLAATGSGKSLCFQIPALLTGKVVVVISPLISLMHDQCLKLSEHGVSACFLGSGQPDSTVEHRAMSGMYGIIYVCPETLLRLIGPLQRLAENRGIALFAIDEVHCVSKWGHDFRPDYRRLSALRENFRASSLHFLKFDIPLMALTATATFRVREDILESLCMSKETKVVLTSFFRPNLRFSVKHSRTTSAKSYEKDFHDLIDTYTREGSAGKRKCSTIQHSLHDEPEISDRSANGSICGSDELSPNDLCASKDDHFSENDADVSSSNQNDRATIEGNQLSVEYLEDELDAIDTVDDLDVACGEFLGHSAENTNVHGSPEIPDQPFKQEQQNYQEGPLEKGPTIIYMPTRKETLRLAQYLCRSGVKAAAYNAKLPKSHLRQVHKEFHQNVLQVVVATIAFGMGIDKTNVRRIIHYGWPQSLEAYYQEAGRAGRDGKLADCILYANLSRVPTLLPSQRSEEQMKQAYKMLADCFRYGMGTACCRAKTLVEYFGETFSYERCLLCDICSAGPPEMQNLKLEADIFMQVLTTQYGQNSCGDNSFDSAICSGRVRLGEKLDLRMVVSKIREQFPKFSTSDRLWWQGLARILEERGCIKEGDHLGRVCIKYPELTELGLKFLHSETMQNFYAYPEADMLLSVRNPKSFSTFSEWGKGWADPKIRRERLQRKKGRRKTRKKNQDWTTVRGRLAAKLSRQK